ncbi:hypothetical protein OVA29_10375 [Exiguobacterium sp. SL14]|nr:hypothetical protein [Exiguobacterium sp. SL14]MCY1691027.1 hypothetical protein [Exiguobacterium sp. SL14]
MSCGFQFGVDDDVEIEDGIFLSRSEAHDLYRSNWIEEGAKVFSPDAFNRGQAQGEPLTPAILEKQLQDLQVITKE